MGLIERYHIPHGNGTCLNVVETFFSTQGGSRRCVGFKMSFSR